MSSLGVNADGTASASGGGYTTTSGGGSSGGATGSSAGSGTGSGAGSAGSGSGGDDGAGSGGESRAPSFTPIVSSLCRRQYIVMMRKDGCFVGAHLNGVVSITPDAVEVSRNAKHALLLQRRLQRQRASHVTGPSLIQPSLLYTPY